MVDVLHEAVYSTVTGKVVDRLDAPVLASSRGRSQPLNRAPGGL